MITIVSIWDRKVISSPRVFNFLLKSINFPEYENAPNDLVFEEL